MLAGTDPRDEDHVTGGRGVPLRAEVRERDDRKEITTFRRWRPSRTVSQGDSAIAGRRATGATTSTIARDCDRPSEERKALPTVQNAKPGSEASSGKGGRKTKRRLGTRTAGPKDMIREVKREGDGAAHSKWCPAC